MIKKGVFFSTDALIALVIIFISILVIYPIITHNKPSDPLQGDILKALSTLKIGEVNNPYVQDLINQDLIKDLNKSILEQIGEFYVDNITLAGELGQEMIATIDMKKNIGIWYGDDIIALKNLTPYETAKNIEVEKQIISGIQKGRSPVGFVAKAWLRKISEKINTLFVKGDAICAGWRTYAWGDYCGYLTNTIDYNFEIPENATVKNATLLAEGSWVNQYFRIYVNGNLIHDGRIPFYRIFDITSFVNSGNNTVRFFSTEGGDDGASHIIVQYNISEMQTFTHQDIFPFSVLEGRSVLHYEKSIFIPSEIYDMNITLNTSRNVNLSFRKGGSSVDLLGKSPVGNLVSFSDAEIKNALNAYGINYNDLSNEYFFFILDIGRESPNQPTVLSNNSYVYVNSSEIVIPYGAIDITQGIQVNETANNLQNTFYRYLKWVFYLPVNAIPILADWQFGWLSTASGATEQNASANGILLYQSPPDDYISAFNRFGYTPGRAAGVFNNGENNFTLEFGNNYGVSDEASYGSLTYFIRSYVNYGDSFDKARGGSRTIFFEDGSSKLFTIGNSSDAWDPAMDAIDDAVERLIEQLDSNNNGRIDLILDQDNFDIDSVDISGVPSIWSTEIQVRKWS